MSVLKDPVQIWRVTIWLLLIFSLPKYVVEVFFKKNPVIKELQSRAVYDPTIGSYHSFSLRVNVVLKFKNLKTELLSANLTNFSNL